jgi:peptidoglycan DL-endopeptidase CwlO
MSLEGFVRAAGGAMGLARDSFGTGAAGEVAPPTSAPAVPGGPAPGTGRALAAFDTESGRLNGHAVALGEQDGSAHAQLASAVAAATAGRDRMNGIIAAATADVHALAPATTTPQGQRALVIALTQRLQDTQRALQDGHADASTHAASSNVTAADYRAVAPIPPNAAATASPASGTSMGAMPLAGLGSLGSLMGSEPGELGAGSAGQQKGATAAAVTDGNAVDAVVSRALSQHGTPYSWGGGGKTGPGRGDDGKVGFDCSSLMQYAFTGAGVDLPRSTYEQIGVGHTVSRSDIQPGDLIFSEFGEGGNPGPGHVQLAISSTHVVEAPHTGADVRVSAVPAGQIVVKRILG